jgi:hypothetical protein
VPFFIQSPGDGSHLSVIDAAAANAEYGIGVFAFATKGGIETLLSSRSIQKLLLRGSYHLVVGTDAITNGSALLHLRDHIAINGGRLTAEAFLNPIPGLFHPKFSAFRCGTHITTVTSSGNLTRTGLGLSNSRTSAVGNWEAFATQTYAGTDASAVDNYILQWVQSNRLAGNLRSVDDGEVLARAVANSQARYIRYTPDTGAGNDLRGPSYATVASLELEEPTEGWDAMIRELPRNRAGQADVSADGLAFLGYEGAPIVALLQHVSLNNFLGPVAEQPLFVNASRNYRFELSSEAQFPYEIGPNDERMILVAVKLDDRTTRYTVVPVTAIQYGELSALLGPPSRSGKGRPMRQLYTRSEWLRANWVGAPPNLLPVTVAAAV